MAAGWWWAFNFRTIAPDLIADHLRHRSGDFKGLTEADVSATLQQCQRQYPDYGELLRATLAGHPARRGARALQVGQAYYHIGSMKATAAALGLRDKSAVCHSLRRLRAKGMDYTLKPKRDHWRDARDTAGPGRHYKPKEARDRDLAQLMEHYNALVTFPYLGPGQDGDLGPGRINPTPMTPDRELVVDGVPDPDVTLEPDQKDTEDFAAETQQRLRHVAIRDLAGGPIRRADDRILERLAIENQTCPLCGWPGTYTEAGGVCSNRARDCRFGYGNRGKEDIESENTLAAPSLVGCAG